MAKNKPITVSVKVRALERLYSISADETYEAGQEFMTTPENAEIMLSLGLVELSTQTDTTILEVKE